MKKQRQQHSNNLILSLFGSMLIHGLVAFVLSSYRSLQSIPIEKPVEIIIVDRPQPKSPEVVAPPQPKPESTSAVQPRLSTPKPSNPVKTAPKPSRIVSSPVKQRPNLAPKPVTPPPKVEQSQPKIKPTPPVNQKPNLPLPNSNETPVKSPKIPPQPIKPITTNPPLERFENSELATKPLVNSDRYSEKPVIPRNNKPIESETSQQETNSTSTLNRNSGSDHNQDESTQPESSSIADHSSTQTNSEQNSTARESEAEKNNSTTEDNSSTAANTIPAKPEKPLSISCRKNCQPKYPSVLSGVEGSAGIQLTIDANGQVFDAKIAVSNGNPTLDREALKSARQMEFSSIDRDRATVRINISFTVAGSDFERQAREEKKERARKEKERLEQLEQARQAELERERQRLEQERKQAELERKQRETRQELPNPTDSLEQERWRKFRESRENYQ